jgi:hypothetical protein
MILFGSLLLSSCGKKRTIYITATNPVTNQPYAGLEYRIVSSVSGAEDGEGTKTVASGNLDANGEAVVELREKRRRRYVVRVFEPPNTCYNKSINMFFGSPSDENGHFNFEFAECASLQRKVKNTSCFDTNDKIEIYIDNTVHSLLSTPWTLNGCADYTTVPSQVPIGHYTLHWIVTKNNISTDYYDSFDLVENETKFHEINY